MFWLVVAAMACMALAFVVVPMVRGGSGRKSLLLIALMLSVPLSGVVGYEIGRSSVGTSALQAATDSNPPAESSSAPDPLKMVAQLEAKLNAGAGTPDQWLMLARSYSALKRYPDAVSAYAKATAFIQDDAQMYADYADAVGMAKGGLDQEVEALIGKALQIDPSNPKALALKGTAAFNRKDYSSAILNWEKMLASPSLSEEWANGTRANIEEARSLLQKQKK